MREINPRLNLFNSYKKMGNIVNPYMIYNPKAWTPSLRSNLVTCLEFNEISGTTANAANIGGLAGAYGSAVTINQTGLMDKSFKVNTGVNSDVRFANNQLLSPSDGLGNDVPFSISVWVKFIDNTGNNWFFCKRNQNDTQEYDLYAFGGAFVFRIGNGLITPMTFINASIPQASLSLNNTSWFNFICTYDGSKSQNGLKIYKNGALLTTTKTMTGTYLGNNNSATQPQIGNIANWQVPLKGYVDQTAFWRKELTQSDVTELYNNGVGKPYL